MPERKWRPGDNIDHAGSKGSKREYQLNRPEPNDTHLSLANELAQQGYGKGLVLDWIDEEYDARIYRGILSAYNPSFQGYQLLQRTKDSEKTMHVAALKRYADAQKK